MKRPKKQTVQDVVFVLTGIAATALALRAHADGYAFLPYVAGVAFGAWAGWYGKGFEYRLQAVRRAATGTATTSSKEDAK